MPQVDSKHPEYIENCEKWELMKNILKGDVKEYIMPIVDELGSRTSNEYKKACERNRKYRELARFLNFTLQTKNGLVGVATSKPGIIELPPELEYLLLEASGNRLKIDQLITQYIGELLTVGRAGGYVDYPVSAGGMTEAERKAQDINPRMYFYDALSIFNWDTQMRGGIDRLSFVVLCECVPKRIDGFKWQKEYQFRVLELEPQTSGESIFKVTVMDKVGKLVPPKEGETNPTYPKKNGKYWNEIPFVFFGATDNDTTVDYGPLQAIGHINIGHYRNSAGYEDNLETHGQSTAVVTSDLPKDQWKRLYQNRPIKMGSKEAYYVGTQGGIELVQCAPAPEIATAMVRKEEQMIALGAFVMLPTSANAPVETTRLHTSAKTSILGTIVSNAEDGLLQMIKWCGEYKGLDEAVLDKIIFSLNYDYVPEQADPAVMRELAAQWVAGLIPKSVVLNYDRKADLIPDSVSDEDLEKELALQGPVGLPEMNPDNSNNEDSAT